MQSICIVICNTNIIGKLMNESSSNMVKWSFIIFQKEWDQCLLLSNDKTWKKSRLIILSLFHFGMLRDREVDIEAPFVQAYLALNDENIYDEAI
jgi:hypothetical protein